MLLVATSPVAAELPPVPVPAENPITEEKRVLGKILFWDEQLSSDDSIACGTCHRPASGGADPRAGYHPGALPGTIDDVAGSPGISRMNDAGQPVQDPIFGTEPQVTARIAPSVFGALWAESLFWDGRASGRFLDPDTGQVVIEAGGALESQALITLASTVEMAKPQRSWNELIRKLAGVPPLQLADRWPADVADAIDRLPSYPALFAAAFGDDTITAPRIAMAVATYERTLVADQTPWDRYQAGDESALDPIERFGLDALQAAKCTSCHTPPLFTNHAFSNIGLRRTEFDSGRAEVSGNPEDAGAMRVPSLRNVGLRQHFMHTGQFTNLGEAINFYRNAPTLPDVDTLPDGSAYGLNLSRIGVTDVQAFLINALTDPRVAAETFPFDRPRLASERQSQ